jgi:hypothetical protein
MSINLSEQEKISLSIIIVSYNTKNVTKNCLESILTSLKSTKLDYEIILVDNASTDGSVELLREFAAKLPNLKLLENKENLGFAKANNEGARQARGNYLLFLNSDIIVLDDAVEKIIGYYRENERKVHFLGGKLLNKDYSNQPSCGPFYSLPVIFGALFLRGDYWGLTRSSPDLVKEVDWVSGACILTKKEYFEEIKGFDEEIFMYMDEVDLLYRAKKTGYRVYFYPEAKFIHLGSASSRGKTYPILQVFRGFLYFYRKHHNDFLSIFFLKFMLKLKSLVALSIGKITKNRYLVETYEKAYQVANMA